MYCVSKKSEDTKSFIVDVAGKIFARYGFKKTTMEEIAKVMHKGRSTIYHYFKNKEDIFCAIIEKEGNSQSHDERYI